jgi:hypothetical protein
MRALWLQLLNAQPQLGWRLPWTALAWLVRPKYLLITRDLAAPLPPVPDCAVTRWSRFVESDAEALCAANPALTEADLRHRLADGQQCYLGWVGPTLVNYRWETTRPTQLPYLGRIIRPRPGQVFVGEVFTAPAFRRRGIDSAAATLALHRMRAEAVHQALGLVAWWNSPELRVARHRWDARTPGAIGYWNLGGRRRYFASGAVRLDTGGGFWVEL